LNLCGWLTTAACCCSAQTRGNQSSGWRFGSKILGLFTGCDHFEDPVEDPGVEDPGAKHADPSIASGNAHRPVRAPRFLRLNALI
jgi:hypothetical protein